MIGVHATVEADGVLRGLAEIRRDVQRDVVNEMTDYGRRRVVPTAQRLAPGIVASTITVRAAATQAYLTTTARGKQRRIVGVTNYGGVIRTTIEPRRARALRLADGRFVARVTTPRRIRGKRYLDKAVAQHADGMRAHLERTIPQVMQRHITRGA